MGPMRSCIQPSTLRSARVKIMTVSMTTPMTAAIWATETASLKLSSVTIMLLTQILTAALHAPKACPGISIAKQSVGWGGENNRQGRRVRLCLLNVGNHFLLVTQYG